MNSYQTEYLQVWTQAFAQFLGWSTEQTLSWAKRLLDGMDPPGMVINEPPLFYVARELAWRQPYYDGQPYYDDLSQFAKWDLIRAIQSVLSPDHGRDFPNGFDFEAARRQIEKLLCQRKPQGE